MRHDADFVDHVAARWPGLVRTLVLLGCPPESAAAVARVGAARAHAAWGRARREDDVEAHLYRSLLDVVARERRQGWVDPCAAQVQLDSEPATAECAVLGHDLDRLTFAERAVRVLAFTAGLDGHQISTVLGLPSHVVEATLTAGVGEQERYRRAGESIATPAAPGTELLTDARTGRGRTRRRRAGWLGTGLALVTLATWWGSRPAPEPEPDPPLVAQVANSLDHAWWANGVLSLDRVAVALPRVDDLVEVADGVVVGDRRGDVIWVADDGTLTTLGHKRPSAPLVASATLGWVVWVEADEQSPVLVVHDLATGDTVARRELAATGARSSVLTDGGHPIALDGRTLFYAAPDGDWRWQLPDGEPRRVGSGGLLDVAAGVSLRQQSDDLIDISSPTLRLDGLVAGTESRLSPDGMYALSRTTRQRETAPFGAVHLYTTRTGAPVWSGLGPNDLAVAASFVADDRVSYIVVARDDAPKPGEFVRLSFSAPYELRTCDLSAQTCESPLRLPFTGALPVLPQ